MFNKNSGYSGYSMSNRAVAAYANGEKPYSKWRKSELLAILKRSLDASVYDAVSKFSCEVLKKVFLYRSSWHHTGKFCSETDFYSFDDIVLEKENDVIIELLRNCDAIMKEEEKKVGEYVRINYIEWVGTRRHPKALHREGIGILIGDWVYFSKYKKKKVSGKYVDIVARKDDLRGKTFTKEEKEQLKAIKKELKK